MSDTATLTNRDIAIAKARADGWRVEHHEGRDWRAIEPGGKMYPAMGNEAAAWEAIADKVGRDYLGDANAALSLIDFMGFQMFWEDGKWGVFVGIEGQPDFWHENPALVVCRAWYKEHKEREAAQQGGEHGT